MKTKDAMRKEFELFLSVTDTDHDIEMRWHHEYDGSTKWHTLFKEESMARYGFYPWEADYRLKKTK